MHLNDSERKFHSTLLCYFFNLKYKGHLLRQRILVNFERPTHHHQKATENQRTSLSDIYFSSLYKTGKTQLAPLLGLEKNSDNSSQNREYFGLYLSRGSYHGNEYYDLCSVLKPKQHHGVERNYCVCYEEYFVSQHNIRSVTMSWWSCIRVKPIDFHSVKE